MRTIASEMAWLVACVTRARLTSPSKISSATSGLATASCIAHNLESSCGFFSLALDKGLVVKELSVYFSHGDGGGNSADERKEGLEFLNAGEGFDEVNNLVGVRKCLTRHTKIVDQLCELRQMITQRFRTRSSPA